MCAVLTDPEPPNGVVGHKTGPNPPSGPEDASDGGPVPGWTRAVVASRAVRSAKARIRQELKSLPKPEGVRQATGHILAPQGAARHLTVQQAVGAIRGNGKKRCGIIIRAANIDGHRKLGELAPGERARLANILRDQPNGLTEQTQNR